MAAVAGASEPYGAAEFESVDSLQTEQEDELAGDLEILFTEYVPEKDGVFVVDEQAITADGHEASLGDFEALAAILNSPNPSQMRGEPTNENLIQTRDAQSYAKCLIWGALGIPATAFSAGTWQAIVTGIKANQWKFTASTIVRALGPAFVNGAGKAIGGPVTIAAALVVAAGLCAFQQ
ncbi:hypothetical protein [Corynebacterium casei]|uniref:hypothetical protein n=1 Tax=Corynebacterium casei TaxID=160386 RepID=UPI003FD45B10